jgi:hypothetical protein
VIRYWINKGLIEIKREGLSPESRIVISLDELNRVKALLPEGDIIDAVKS